MIAKRDGYKPTLHMSGSKREIYLESLTAVVYHGIDQLVTCPAHTLTSQELDNLLITLCVVKTQAAIAITRLSVRGFADMVLKLPIWAL